MHFCFRKPIRIHANGHRGDLILNHAGGGCGDLEGLDAIGAHFEGEQGGFVISFADLQQAVRAIKIERSFAREQRIRDSAPALAGTPQKGATEK